MTIRTSAFIQFIIFGSLLIAGCSDNDSAVQHGVADDALSTVTAQATDTTPTVSKKEGPHGSYDPHASLGDASMIKVALQHYQEGRSELAMQTLAEALDRYPGSAQVYAVRASLLLQSNDITAALQDLEKAATLAPNDASIRVNRAQAYRAFGRDAEAMSDLDHAVSMNPDLLAARFNRGALHFANNDFDKALVDFDRCIAIDPHLPGPYFNRASTYYSLGRKPDAVADLEHFLKLSDNAEWKKSAEALLKSWQSKSPEEAEKDTRKS